MDKGKIDWACHIQEQGLWACFEGFVLGANSKEVFIPGICSLL